VNPGPYRQRITFRNYTKTQRPGGQEQRTWSDAGTFWCRLRTDGGAKFTVSEQLRSKVSHVIEMRNVLSVLAIVPDMRVTFQGRTLLIRHVIDPENLGRILLLHCEEVVSPPP
jgi:SPP1 family predicted phage head-tail adaptor